MDIKRIVNLPELLHKNSFFLLGPRATGKSFLIKSQLKGVSHIFDLLDGETHLRFLEDPTLLEKLCAKIDTEKYIVIDEIQRNPELLNQVHRMIENEGRRFLLTGSSARKLKAGGANLLAGRAWEASLFPLTWFEIGNEKFNLERYLRFGGLPRVVLLNSPDEELYAYAQTYLREEIQAEGLVRKIPQFSRFLKVAALSNGQMLNYSSVASDSGVKVSSVREYFSILEDTLIGFSVGAWSDSQKRKAIETSKFYLFDTGIAHTLAGTKHIDRNSDSFGRSFEHFIAIELRSYISYRRLRIPLCYWRTINGQEVDFVLDDVAMEVKATSKASNRDIKGLKALAEEGKHKRFLCISTDPMTRSEQGIEYFYWEDFLRMLWNDEIIKART